MEPHAAESESEGFASQGGGSRMEPHAAESESEGFAS